MKYMIENKEMSGGLLSELRQYSMFTLGEENKLLSVKGEGCALGDTPPRKHSIKKIRAMMFHHRYTTSL